MAAAANPFSKQNYAASGGLSWPDELTAAIATVRADSNPTDWVLAGYETKESLKLLGAGEGGIAALQAALIEGDVCYGLVRSKFEFEKVGSVTADTVKFTFVYWRPEGIPVSRKMKIGVYEGSVKRLFAPYHADIEAAEQDELGEEVLAALLGGITMRTDKTSSDKATIARAMKPGQQHASVAATATGGGGAGAVDRSVSIFGAKGGGGGGGGDKRSFLPTDGGTAAQARFATGGAKGANVSVEDEAALKEALASIRSDEAGADDWCLLGYKDKKTLSLLGRGGGGCDAMVAAFPSDGAAYGMFKTTDTIDRTTQAKHCFAVWQPETLPPMRKALISTHKGAATGFFRPFHVDFFVTEREELSDAIARDHISALSGSKSHVTTRRQQDVDEERRALQARRHGESALGGVTAGVVQQQAKQALLVGEEGADDEAADPSGLAALQAALAAVRSDDDGADWALAAFSVAGAGKKPRLLAKGGGSGGRAALVTAIEACGATYAYGLLRVVEVIGALRCARCCDHRPPLLRPAGRGAAGAFFLVQQQVGCSPPLSLSLSLSLSALFLPRPSQTRARLSSSRWSHHSRRACRCRRRGSLVCCAARWCQSSSQCTAACW